MFGNCCNTCCPADSNRGLFGICLNDATLVIILLAIWLLSSGGLWNLFLRLIPVLWLLCGAWVVVVWRQRPPTPHRQRVLTLFVGGLLLTLTAVTAFFVYVFWAWSQM